MKYIVAYLEDDDDLEQHFLCEADDADHAKEQCQDASYSGVEILWVGRVVLEGI